jgi:hypothetical protein
MAYASAASVLAVGAIGFMHRGALSTPMKVVGAVALLILARDAVSAVRATMPPAAPAAA